MTVAQLRRALKGLAPDTPVVLWDNYLMDFHAQAEVGINQRGTVQGVRLTLTKQLSPLQTVRLDWRTVE